MKSKVIFKSHANTLAEFLPFEIDNKLGKKLAFSLVYNPPSCFHLILDPLNSVMSDLLNKYEDVIFVGDFNINLLHKSSNSVSLKRFLLTNGLSASASEFTNFVPGKNPSQINLVLVKNITSLKRFSQLTLGSFTSIDLLCSSYSFLIDKNAENSFSYRNLNVDKNTLISSAINMNWDLLYSIAEIDGKVQHLTSLISNLLEIFCPTREVVDDDIGKPRWVSDDLQRLMNVRDYFHEAARKEKVPFMKVKLWNNFKRLRNKVTTLKRNLTAKFSS